MLCFFLFFSTTAKFRFLVVTILQMNPSKYFGSRSHIRLYVVLHIMLFIKLR